ncbi:hypothetical protein GCM10009682_44010 [Luedemannella flava]|uniref:Uncharacterized protein n=1 Tax=Luedemannella flava TaxID=349316 RepID=A0ABN2MCA4_9ACTN
MGDGGTVTTRIIGIYATKWRHHEPATEDTRPTLELGRLTEFYDFYRDQLPRQLHHEPVARFVLDQPLPDGTLVDVQFWLFALPSDSVVAAVTLDLRLPALDTDAAPTSAALEAFIYAGFTIDGLLLSDHIALRAAATGAEELTLPGETLPLLPERHMIVFAGEPGDPLPTDDVVAQALYRRDPPYRQEFAPVVRPPELNQGRTLGAITPYASLLYGHEDFLRDSIFLSTVQAVGTACRFRQIWHEAHRRVRDFRHNQQREEIGTQQRADMEVLVDHLGNLEFDLTFSVEFPLMRIESFFSALYQAMDLPKQADTLSDMFAQLAGSIRSEIMAIDIREREVAERAARERRDADLRQQRRNALAASTVTIIAVPTTLLVSFFGINASQVDGNRSMFDHHYLGAYVVAIGLALIPAAVWLHPYIPSLWRRRRRR